MWGECILYMPGTESAMRASKQYFYEREQWQKQYEKEEELKRENERLRIEIERLKGVNL